MTQAAASPSRHHAPSRTMRAAVLAAPGRIEIADVPVPQPAENQLRVRIEGCGVCASNIPPFEGREWFTYPFRPGQMGHEAWGIVDATAPGVEEFRPGDRVAILSCNAYAQYDLAERREAIRLPSSLARQPFPAEPLACAINVVKRSAIRPGQTVAIVGIGFLGALLVQLARGAGARVIAITRRAFALDIARRTGAEIAIPMDDHGRIIAQVKDLTAGRFCDVVIEAVGKQWPLDLAAELTRERGRLVIAGYHQDGPRQCNLQLWNWRGLDVINAHERDPDLYVQGMREAVDAVARGTLDPFGLFTHRLPLEQLPEALTMTRDRPDGFMKALVFM